MSGADRCQVSGSNGRYRPKADIDEKVKTIPTSKLGRNALVQRRLKAIRWGAFRSKFMFALE